MDDNNIESSSPWEMINRSKAQAEEPGEKSGGGRGRKPGRRKGFGFGKGLLSGGGRKKSGRRPEMAESAERGGEEDPESPQLQTSSDNQDESTGYEGTADYGVTADSAESEGPAGSGSSGGPENFGDQGGSEGPGGSGGPDSAAGPGGPGGPGISTKNTAVQKAVVFVAVLTSLTTTFMGSATNLAIPNISGDFSVSAAAVGWIVTAYMLPVATLTVPFGRIADLSGRKRVLVLGLGIFCAGSLLAMISGSFPMLIAARVVQAVGAAMIFATNHAILIAEFPPWQRGKALGYALGATYVGLSLGPVLGGIINSWFGWRHIFTAALIVGVVAILSAIKMVPERPVEVQGEFDYKGNLLYVLMIVLVIFGLADFSMSAGSILLVPVGIVVGVYFVKHELKQDEPMVDVRLFAENKAYTFSNLAALLNYAATFAISYLLSIYLQMVGGYSSQTAGLILIAQPVVMAILTPRMGSLSDRVSPHKLASFGMAFCAAALALLAFINIETPLWAIIGILILTGIGFGIFSSPNTNAVMSCVPKSSFGVASSVLATMRNLGQNTSMVILTIIISARLGDVTLAEAGPTQLVSTMRIAYIIFALICVAGIFCSFQRRKLDKK